MQVFECVISVCAVRQNHARECMKEYDLSGVDGIVIASGDGLLHEVSIEP